MEAEPYLADRSTLPKTQGALRMCQRTKRKKCGGEVYVSSEFSIICKEEYENSPKLLTTVFGYVHKGLGVCEYISRLNPDDQEIIVHSCGTWIDPADEEMEQDFTVLPATRRFISSPGDGRVCYIQFSIDGSVQSKILFQLDSDAAPSMCEVFLGCCQSSVDSLSYKSYLVTEVSDQASSL
jgi:cyclophilin family peptidyl-prolyl cis-trans isomerase